MGSYVLALNEVFLWDRMILPRPTKIYNPLLQKIVVAKDVIFDEFIMGALNQRGEENTRKEQLVCKLWKVLYELK